MIATVATAPASTARKGGKRTRHYRLPLARLRSNLGGQPALMALQYGSKRRTQAWAECRHDERLKTKNVAVIQGDRYRHPTRGTVIDCGGVCSIDIDGNSEHGITPESVAEQLFELNPHLRWSFRTAGKRGFNVWIRITGSVPKGFNLHTAEGIKVGEFRATGNYTVVAGKHPDGPNYRTIVDLPAHSIPSLQALKWIDGKPFSEKGTQDIHRDVREGLKPLNGCIDLVEPMVREHLPAAPHQTCKLHFDLAGDILGSGYQLTWPESLDIGRIWFDLANKRHLRSNVDREGYAKEFAARFSKRKYPKGGGSSEIFDQAVERANLLDPPQIAAECFPHDPQRQLIATLCRELARDSANKRFFLSARTIQAILESGTPKLGSAILKDLESIGVIACVDRPPRGTRKANTYLYLLNDFDLEVSA